MWIDSFVMMSFETFANALTRSHGLKLAFNSMFFAWRSHDELQIPMKSRNLTFDKAVSILWNICASTKHSTFECSLLIGRISIIDWIANWSTTFDTYFASKLHCIFTTMYPYMIPLYIYTIGTWKKCSKFLAGNFFLSCHSLLSTFIHIIIFLYHDVNNDNCVLVLRDQPSLVCISMVHKLSMYFAWIRFRLIEAFEIYLSSRSKFCDLVRRRTLLYDLSKYHSSIR